MFIKRVYQEKASLKVSASSLTLDQDGKKRTEEVKEGNGTHCSRTLLTWAPVRSPGKTPENLFFPDQGDQDLWDPLTPMASSRHCVISSGVTRIPDSFSLRRDFCIPLQNPAHLQTIPGHLQKRVVSMQFPLCSNYLSAGTVPSRDWKFPQGQASCLLVSCPARGQAHSREGEHGALGAVKALLLLAAVYLRCCGPSSPQVLSPFIVRSKRGEERLLSLFSLEKKPSGSILNNICGSFSP